MVIKQWLFSILLLFTAFHLPLKAGWGADSVAPYVDISASIDIYQSYENHPLKGIIAVTHDANSKVDISSFQMDNKPLKVSLVKKEKMSDSSPLLVSIYNFDLPAQPKGLYLLPSISALINGKKYLSTPVSYEVSGVETVEGKSNASLALKSYIEGPPSFYPGERGRFVYRFYFTGNIELNKESLPLLEAQGFKKIGGKRVKDLKESTLSIEEVSQEVEAIKPGKYSFDSAYVEGQAYYEDSQKKRSYFQPTLKAETSDLIVQVLPFPTQNKPASFNGAVGTFTLQTSLMSQAKVYLGDKIDLAVAVTGNSNLNTVHLPDLHLQPNFQGLFRLSDLPPAEEIHGDTKIFTLELRPLSSSITQIPPLEFSYFDPNLEKYKTIQSTAIPLVVSSEPKPVPEVKPIEKIPPPTPVPQAAPQKQPTISPKVKQPASPSVEPTQMKNLPTETPLIPLRPPVIEIQSNYPLNNGDLSNRSFGTWWVLLLIPFGILIVVLQVLLRNYLAKKEDQITPKSGQELFDEAMQAAPSSPQFFDLLNKAFLQRLVEKGELISAEISPEKLPSKGPAGVVRTFLCDIEARRFSGTQTLSHAELGEQALALFNTL